MTRTLSIALLLLPSFLSFAQKNTVLFEDFIYDQALKTPILSAAGSEQRGGVPVLDMDAGGSLRCAFDWLGEAPPQLRAKFFHCDASWQRSVLNDVEFLPDFNDFPLYDFRLSQGTKVGYTQYSFEIPRMKLPGNYVLVVHRGRGEPVLTRRFMVVQHKVRAGGRVTAAAQIAHRNTHQQVEFTLNYAGATVINPASDFNVVIRQNFRWQRTLSGFKPFMVNEAGQQITYRFFDDENQFLGGNEFRFFDTRNRQIRGVGVAKIEQLSNFNVIILVPDTPQERLAYVQQNDMDGQFGIGSTDDLGDPDYTPVTFTLTMPEREQAPYVLGGFNFFRADASSKMQYNPENQAYQHTTILKQGVYNYLYSNVLGEENSFEGSHAFTQNTYEIFIYQRPPGARADQLVGYQIF